MSLLDELPDMEDDEGRAPDLDRDPMDVPIGELRARADQADLPAVEMWAGKIAAEAENPRENSAAGLMAARLDGMWGNQRIRETSDGGYNRFPIDDLNAAAKDIHRAIETDPELSTEIATGGDETQFNGLYPDEHAEDPIDAAERLVTATVQVSNVRAQSQESSREP